MRVCQAGLTSGSFAWKTRWVDETAKSEEEPKGPTGHSCRKQNDEKLGQRS